MLASLAGDGGSPDLSSLVINLVCVVAISLSILSAIIFSCADDGGKQQVRGKGQEVMMFRLGCSAILNCCSICVQICGACNGASSSSLSVCHSCCLLTLILETPLVNLLRRLRADHRNASVDFFFSAFPIRSCAPQSNSNGEELEYAAMEEEDYAQKPLLATPSSSTCDLIWLAFLRIANVLIFLLLVGNFWTTTAHIITAVIGSGVLSLAWSVAQLGWIGGPVSMLIFAAVTVLSSLLLADCYRSPDPETGSIISHTYMQSVRQHLGAKDELACALLQQILLYGTAIAYVITSAISMSRALSTNGAVER
ncbi:hypothetical protein EJ110_NYTH31608 [Nymphaea thermarum]|nr:hypothetical protein EJ110_NYTH31608 [Nymphaea thermarum]